MDRLAPGGGEHVVIGPAPFGTYFQPFLGLAFAVIPQHLHGARVDADGAGPAALGGALDALACDDRGRACDAGLAEVQVTTSRNALRSTAWTYSMVRGARPAAVPAAADS